MFPIDKSASMPNDDHSTEDAPSDIDWNALLNSLDVTPFIDDKMLVVMPPADVHHTESKADGLIYIGVSSDRNTVILNRVKERERVSQHNPIIVIDVMKDARITDGTSFEKIFDKLVKEKQLTPPDTIILVEEYE